MEPEEIFEREVLARHAVPSAPRWAGEPEPRAAPGLDDEATLAADRAWLVQALAARSQKS
ncbi:hypothetical protein [Streptosporangium amethystogenes]|uniref:hypothetical protein n=1 Tax=Streptosporangium amethystogenes TaxID=2002 RepID=UPI0004C598FE|nr:hypothetical protein [Streptosporangium amethystogenes]